MADKDKEKSKVDLGLLEEDDEFEEFSENIDFGKGKDDAEEELSVWEDNWDDDNLVEDDFSEQLKAQMKK
ncbi:unnamed protein product [Diamesa serratosioi]